MGVCHFKHEKYPKFIKFSTPLNLIHLRILPIIFLPSDLLQNSSSLYKDAQETSFPVWQGPSKLDFIASRSEFLAILGCHYEPDIEI